MSPRRRRGRKKTPLDPDCCPVPKGELTSIRLGRREAGGKGLSTLSENPTEVTLPDPDLDSIAQVADAVHRVHPCARRRIGNK